MWKRTQTSGNVPIYIQYTLRRGSGLSVLHGSVSRACFVVSYTEKYDVKCSSFTQHIQSIRAWSTMKKIAVRKSDVLKLESRVGLIIHVWMNSRDTFISIRPRVRIEVVSEGINQASPASLASRLKYEHVLGHLLLCIIINTWNVCIASAFLIIPLIHYRRSYNFSTVLACNTALAALIYSIINVWSATYMIIWDQQATPAVDALCSIRAYVYHSSIAAVHHSFLLQAIHR